MAVQYRKPVDDEVPWQQRLANYAQNRTAGQDEYKRALEVFRGKSAAGDTEGANSAKTWADQVNTAIGGTGSQYGDDVRSQLSNLQQRAQTVNPEVAALRQQINTAVNRKPTQFSYDKDNDPAYKAALESARQNTQTAAGNIAADMNKRGLLNSTITQDRGNQAAAQEYNRVTNEVLPQLVNQAYQRFQGQQQQEQQQLANMFNLANTYDNQDQQQYARLAQALGLQNQVDQQQIANERAQSQQALQSRQANLAAYLQAGQALGYSPVDGPKEDWSLLFQNSDSDPSRFMQNLTGRQLANSEQQQALQRALQEAGVTGLYNGQPTLQRQAQEFNQQAENRRIGISAEGQSLSRDRLAWDRDPNNLDNQYKQAQIDKLKNEGSAPNSKQFEAEVVSNLKNMTPEMRQQFFDNEQEAIVNSIGVTGYNRLYNQYFDRYGDPK